MPPYQKLLSSSFVLEEANQRICQCPSLSSITTTEVEEENSHHPILRQNVVKRRCPTEEWIHEYSTFVLPNIHDWIKKSYHHYYSIMSSNNNSTRSLTTSIATNDIRQQIESNPLWLDGVIHEIHKVIPVGKMSKPIWDLSYALIQYFDRMKKKEIHVGRKALNLFSRLLREEDENCRSGEGREFVVVTSTLYTLLMRIVPESSEIIFMNMVLRHKQYPLLRCKPTLSNRVTLITSMIHNGDTKRALHLLWTNAPVSLFNTLLLSFESPLDATRLLERMEQSLSKKIVNIHSNSITTKPTLHSFEIVMKKWCHVGNGKKAYEILEQLIVWAKTYPTLRPPVSFFVIVMKAYSKDNLSSTNVVDKLMIRLEHYVKFTPPRLKKRCEYRLNHEPYEVQMRIWFRKKKKRPAQEFESFFLTKMKEMSILPTRICLAMILKSWIATGKVKEAERVLYDNNEESSYDVGLCNLILRGWCSFRQIQKAEDFFERWMCQRPSLPDVNSYEILLSAWNTSMNLQKDEHIQYLLQHFQNQMESDDQLNPTSKDFHLILDALTKSKHKLFLLQLWWHKFDFCLEKDHPLSLFQQGGNGDGSSCGKNRSAGEKTSCIHDIFFPMKEWNIVPTTLTFRCLIVAFKFLKKRHDSISRRKQKSDEGAVTMTMSDAEFCNLILAICFTIPSVRAKESVRTTILPMMKEYTFGNFKMRPVASFFSYLFSKLYDARHTIPVRAAMAVVENFDFPNDEFASSCFTYGLTVCAWSLDPEAPLISYRISQLIPQQPISIEHLKLVLCAYANHPNHALAELAESSLNDTIDMGIPLTEDIIAIVIRIVTKQRKMQAAYALLQRFESRVSKPSTLSYVLLACALSSKIQYERYHHFQLAYRAFMQWKEAKKEITSLHYLYLMTCAMRLRRSNLRTTILEQLMNQCRADNLVSDKIIRRYTEVFSNVCNKSLI